jgi:multicomponent Na+:H+ antiporter subunit C
VGVSTTALGLALVVRIRENYGTIEEEDILLSEERQITNELLLVNRE